MQKQQMHGRWRQWRQWPVLIPVILMVACVALLAACGPSAGEATNGAASARVAGNTEDSADDNSADGSALFETLGCSSCHQMNGQGPGPSLAGQYGQAISLESGEQVTMDDEYIRTSILDPHAQTHAGYLPIMPSFKGRVNDAQLDALVAYIRTLE